MYVKSSLDQLDDLNSDKAAGSGIPEIKTILSGAYFFDSLTRRLYLYAMQAS